MPHSGDDPRSVDFEDLHRPLLDLGLLHQNGDVRAQLGDEAEQHEAHSDLGEELVGEHLGDVGGLATVTVEGL